MTNFQIAILGIFGIFILIGVVLFAGYDGGGRVIVGRVSIWGTVNQRVFDELLNDLRRKDKSFEGVSYREISKDSFDQQFVEALASGTGPDVFILPQTLISKHQNKVLKIPYDSYPVRDFKDKFIEEGELYLTDHGILGLPFIVDPLVMYWNRDIFSKNGIANPPESWEEFFSLSQKITEKDDNLNIFTSAVAFGEFRNINNAKEIISTLIMQAGNPITVRNGDVLNVVLDNGLTSSQVVPAEEAVDFFTQFSNPVKSVYTWNRALSSSEKEFLSGDLAIYFGFASELGDLRSKNPNLNFDVASIPQTESGSGTTFGRIYALAITKGAKNVKDAFNTINAMTSNDSLDQVRELTNLPPVSRSLLSKKSKDDPYLEVFYGSALTAGAWLDPNPQKTSEIFKEMIESIVSGRSKTKEAVKRADLEIRELID